MLTVVPMRYGTAFKKAFSHPLAFSALVKGALDIDFHPERIEQEHSFRPSVAHVNIAYDLFAEDVQQRTIVELQHVGDDESYDRFLYYHGIGLAEQIINSDSYSFPRTVYTLVVMTRWPNEPRLQFGRAVGNIDPVTDEGKKLGVYEHRLVFVNARAPSSMLPKGLQRLMALVEDTLDGQVDETKYPDELSQQILRQIEKSKLTAEENATLKEEATWEQAKRETAAEAEARGKATGAREGKAEGLREGKAAGLREGKEEGLRQAVVDLCEVLGVEVTDERRAHLAALDLAGLEALRAELKATKAWPSGLRPTVRLLCLVDVDVDVDDLSSLALGAWDRLRLRRWLCRWPARPRKPGPRGRARASRLDKNHSIFPSIILPLEDLWRGSLVLPRGMFIHHENATRELWARHFPLPRPLPSSRGEGSLYGRFQNETKEKVLSFFVISG